MLGKIPLRFDFHSYESKELHINLVHYVTQSLLFSPVFYAKKLDLFSSGAPLHTLLTVHLNHSNHLELSLAFSYSLPQYTFHSENVTPCLTSPYVPHCLQNKVQILKDDLHSCVAYGNP